MAKYACSVCSVCRWNADVLAACMYSTNTLVYIGNQAFIECSTELEVTQSLHSFLDLKHYLLVYLVSS